MTPDTSAVRPTKNPLVATLLSLVIPGAGQLYLGARSVALAIFATALGLAWLIQFCLENFRVGLFNAGTVTTSWLWLLLLAFWIWNIADAYRRAHGSSASRLVGFAIPLLIIYIIAWQVTDVNLSRLVTRFSDVRVIFNALLHPDLFTRDTEEQVGAVTIWVPCSVPPQNVRPSGGYGYSVEINRVCGTVGDPLVIFGKGFIPNTTGYLFWVQPGGDTESPIRSGDNPLVLTTDEQGQFAASFTIPAAAAREGLDPTAPTAQAIKAQFSQAVGPPYPSENFHDLIGSIEQVPPPEWMVNLGIVPAGATIPDFVPGKIFETIALGLMATLLSVILAAPLSFLGARNIMSRVRGGTAIYYTVRGIFNITRSIDTLIWAIIFVVWVGLGAFAGLLALTLHSTAALAKLYSEEVEHIDPGPIEATTAAGANTLQSIRYSVIPQIIPPFLAYSLLRWDINMRSATVVGFVSAAGVGFIILESIKKGGYEVYAAALWCIAIVVILVDYLSSYWRERILHGEDQVRTPSGMSRLFFAPFRGGKKEEKAAVESPKASGPPKPFYQTRRGIVYIFLFLLLLIASWNLSQIDLSKLLEPGPTLGRLLYDFVAVETSQSVWETIIKNLLITIFQALLATTLGGFLALPFAFLAARNITGRSRSTTWIYYLARFILNFLRSIEALLYVAIFVFWVGIGAFAGMLALAVTTFGLIGKLFSEAVENIEEGPVEALTATGANRLQSIAYAILPQIVPPFISYAIYQWDINIRLATIIGFAGGGGIGLLFQNYTGQLQYHKAGAVILSIVIVVTVMDFASAKIRERLV